MAGRVLVLRERSEDKRDVEVVEWVACGVVFLAGREGLVCF